MNEPSFHIALVSCFEPAIIKASATERMWEGNGESERNPGHMFLYFMVILEKFSANYNERTRGIA